MSNARLSEIVDLERYPIGDLTALQGRTVVETCRQRLCGTGLCLLPGFVRPDAVARMLTEAQTLAPQAYFTEHWRATPHGDGSREAGTIPRETRAAMSAIAYDLIGQGSGVRTLYELTEFTAFLRAALGNDALHPCADPMVSCIMTICRDGDELGWHYDPNDGVVSLLLQSAEQGGGFEFVPNLRGSDPEASARELEVLEGRDGGVLRPRQEPGTLSLFNGNQSLHRVAPVGPGRERIIALFSYAETPDYVFSSEIRENFFGRRS